MNRLLFFTAFITFGFISLHGLAQDNGSPNAAPALTPPQDNAPAPAVAPAPVPVISATPVPPALTPKQIQQREIIRRQQLVFQANQDLITAAKQEAAQNYPEARKNYLSSATVFLSADSHTPAYAQAAGGLKRCDLALYDQALQQGDTATAKNLIDEAVKFNPDDQKLLVRQDKVNQAIANPNDTSILGNPAINPGFVNQVTEVQKLFTEAEQFRRTEQWDEAKNRLKHILALDPHNITATVFLEKINKQELAYDEAARLQTRKERLNDITENWYEPIRNPEVTTSAQENQPDLVRNTNFDLQQKLKSITVSLDFANASITSATDYLSSESKRLDPDQKGVNFIIQPDVENTAKPITLSLDKIPLGEALRYVCQLAGVKFKVEQYAISIVSYNQNTYDLITRTFIVSDSFVTPATDATQQGTGIGNIFSNAALGGNGGGDAARPLPQAPGPGIPNVTDTTTDPAQLALQAKGVKFPPGASAGYNPATGQLRVVNTADQMEFIEELVNGNAAPTLMVRISTKFVEINQSDLNDLTINTAIGFFNPEATANGSGINANGGIPIRTPSYNSSLGGIGNVNANGINALLGNNQYPPENGIAFRGFLGMAQFDVLIQALSQKKSFDLLSEPSVMVKSGEQGTMKALRLFPYPIDFTPPQLQAQNNGNNANNGNNGNGVIIAFEPPAIIPTLPNEFKNEPIGVQLDVNPQIGPDNKTIDLKLFPLVEDFEGFVNYGNPIYVIDSLTNQQLLLTNNVINQPVFNVRKIQTRVSVKDGSTVVMGGLMREDRQQVLDKVPILGDLPLIGRLFQSKVTQSIKRNLLIFVSAHIYRNDGELLNPPETSNAQDVLLGRSTTSLPAVNP